VSRYPERPLGEVLDVDIDEVPVLPDETYKISGVYGFGRGLFARVPIQGSETSYSKLHRIHRGTLVMSRLKAFEGALAVVPDDFNGWFLSPEFPTFRPKEGIGDIRYVKHLCSWPDLWTKLSGESKGLGARRERVSSNRLLSVEVPLPEFDEQRRIAERLDSSFSKLVRVGELRKYVNHASAAIAESLLASVSSEETPKVPVGEVLEAARRPVQIDPDAPYRALGLRSFGKGTIRYGQVPGAELSKLRYFTFPENALVLSNIKAWEGAISVTTKEDLECVASNRFLFYLPRDSRVNIGFVRYYLLSRAGLADVGSCSPGMADRNRTLGVKSFERLRLPLPQRDVQDRVVRVLDGVMSSLAKTAVADGHVAAFRASLLNAAFNGLL
jgi:type I restriction enzyme S subunit